MTGFWVKLVFGILVSALLGAGSGAFAYQDSGSQRGESRASGSSAPASLGAIGLAQLPREARQTLELIKQGGPFPYSRDGIAFGNRERALPRRERGYYHEYTVPTPGAKNRGARRIIAGVTGEYYYTDDHYRSFRRIKE